MASPGSLLLVRSAGDVPHSDAAFGPGSLNLVEVDAKLLGLLLRGLRGVRLLPSAGCLLRRLLTLLRHLLSLLGGLSCRVLACLAAWPAWSSACPAASWACPAACPAVSCTPWRDLTDLIGDPAERTSSALLLAAGESAHGVLHLLHLPAWSCLPACPVPAG